MLKTYMTRIFALALLMMASMGAWADVKVVYGEDGKDTYKWTGGEITASVGEEKGGEVEVTLTVAPDDGYTISKSDIEVYATISPNGTRADDPQISGTLELKGDDPKDLSEKRDYTVTVKSNFGVWVKTANFKMKDSKGGGNRDGVIEISTLQGLQDISNNTAGNYRITADIDNTGTFSTIESFSGTLEAAIDPTTNMPYRITSLSAPLFTTLTGTVKNLVIESVNITTTSGYTGAIACTANGAARIYNVGILDGSVGGAGYTGGLVGFLDDAARVINCYSFANITGGTDVGGIVGYNNVETTSQNLKTMVMNCMFYGDITGGTDKAPIYNGQIITNVSTGTETDNKGVSNFNYFWGDANYVKNRQIDTYNCALMAETRFLQRFEFFRHLLNGHRELAGWWATGSYDKSQMLKWVMEPSQIGTSTPYPILKEQGRYHSVVNIDNLDVDNARSRSIGTILGTLIVNIQMDDANDTSVPFHHPGTGDNEAAITTSQLTLDITDKDPDHYNFNYYKVQLPYYNDVGTKNYTGNRVVTGWKIVSMNKTAGSFTTGDDATADTEGNITSTPYNFADRNCTAKDIYSSDNKRVFNQGAYFDVPEGVTSITIEPYWAKAAYLADAYVDVVYKEDMSTPYNVPNVGGGQIYTNDNNYSIAGDNQKVYTAISNARNALGKHADHTVYDYAIVLVGNAHNIGISSSDAQYPYTIMSADFDHDNEPDYSYILRFNSRSQVHPVRVDFLYVPGLGMAQKSTGGTGTYNFGIMQPLGWFESTNTSLFRVTQLEYDRKNRVAAPYIVQGGVIEQWVNGQNNGATNLFTYFHVGGNVWFKEFHRGTHIDKNLTSKHSPLSVTGGDYGEFYLTGLYKAVTKTNDNAECYINGGRFGTVAGAGMEGIGDDNNNANTKGNIIWQIQNADIDEFYGGGINADSPVRGNITTVITGGYIKQFCGGPKFGDMNSGKTVITTATGCKFDTYFGAGYGGNSYSCYPPTNISSTTGDYGTANWNTFVNNNYKQEWKTSTNPPYRGVSTKFRYEYLPQSNNTQNVERVFIDFVLFSLATAHSVTSNLTNCVITNNFYGGGRLGKVDGPVSSTLTGCTVNGNVFGAGFSAEQPTVPVMNIGGFKKAPFYDGNLGVYLDAEFPDSEEYTWDHRETVNSTTTAIDKTYHILYTTENLEKSNLGSVAGNVTLTLKGNTKVGILVTTTNEETGNEVSTLQENTGNVFGGGESSYVTGAGNKVTVNIQGDTEVYGNVFGGGDKGVVEGSTQVNIKTGD